ncbi:hypothetical protein NSQ77_04500 [Oceanobacillus sp. FSL K6-2867]|uniref:hypothetical protein n=1 Tax=Oceanobacillus sp. FSL K6-2867 TaxID=2954748 RepID=UPI0030DD363D
MKNTNEYKSPIAALLWSVMMTGFGQFYNGQYIFGALLFIFEIAANGLSSLNMSILHSFHGNTQQAHDVFDHQWGLFYPSSYAFSIWQAYNKAIVINCQQEKRDYPKETYLTGFFILFVIGMNLGVYYHHHLLSGIPFFSSPIFNGLSWGFLFGITGHFAEKYIKAKRNIGKD